MKCEGTVLGEMLTCPQLNVDFVPIKTEAAAQSKKVLGRVEVTNDDNRELLCLSST